MALGAKYPLAALISIVLVLLNLAAFVVLLGGAAALQKDAAVVVGLLNTVNSLPGQVLSFGDLMPVNTQGNFISYQWFKACFQAVALLIALACLATGQMYRFRVALVGLFAALGVLFSDSSSTFYYLYLQAHNNPAVPSRIKKDITTFFSGCIITATLNFLLIITLGTGLQPHHPTQGSAEPYTHPAKEANGAGAAV